MGEYDFEARLYDLLIGEWTSVICGREVETWQFI